MRKFLLAISMLALTNVASAQSPVCIPSDKLVQELLDEYHELPIITSTDERELETLVFFANVDTGTWTIVVFDENFTIGCATATGKNFKLIRDSHSLPKT